jgi:hypothetical protein
MMIRSVLLFVHIVGVLTLFIGLALEWLSLASLRKANTPTQALPWVKVLRGLPRYIAIAVGLIVVSGIYLAVRVGVFGVGWVRASLGAMVLMGLLGGPVIRSRMRVLLAPGDAGEGTPGMLRRHATDPLLIASLRIRASVALAIVYLMIAKLDLDESLLLIGLALVLGAATSVPGWRAQPS